MQTDEVARKRVEHYLESPYDGSTRIYHLIEVLRDLIGLERLKASVVAPLTGEKIACYYGCLFLRPREVMGLLDAENPQLMDLIVEAMGAKAVTFPYRTDCCGSYHAYQQKQISQNVSQRIILAAKSAGATQMVTACPLCKYNLEHCQKDWAAKDRLTVNYITAPIAQAMGGLAALEQSQSGPQTAN
ncbi:MAG: heterodisulfide reductase-related iron-sulfur binding cluster [Bacillota bacterium]|nr:heterodisulfide reductase-related iron-sulfur binding cluster [Bacillota bacterium]